MAKQVVLSPTALANYESILQYLIGEWGVSVANDFIERFIKVRIVLSENTEIFSLKTEVSVYKNVYLRNTTSYFLERQTTLSK
jgi:plasmid stabilization system protein ParE